MEDVRASGDDARGELCPADLRNILVRKKRKGPPARWAAWIDNIFMSSWSEFGSSCNCMSTECDLEENRLAKMLSLGSPSSGGAVPIKRRLEGSDGTEGSRGSSVDQERLVDAQVGQN